MAGEALCTIEIRARRDAERAGIPAAGWSSEIVAIEGDVAGAALAGTLRGSVRRCRRADGLAKVELHGLIRTGRGAVVALTAEGRETEEGRLVLLPVFDAHEADLAGLNVALCVAEGRMDGETGIMTLAVRRVA